MEPPATDLPGHSPSSSNSKETPYSIVLELSNLIHARQVFPRDQAPQVPAEHEQAQEGHYRHVKNIPVAVLLDKRCQGQQLVNVHAVVRSINIWMRPEPGSFGSLDIMANPEHDSMVLLMNLHIRVRKPDSKTPADPNHPCSIDDGDPLEFGEPKEMPGQ